MPRSRRRCTWKLKSPVNNSQVLLKLFDHWFRSQAVYAEEESQQKIQTSSYVPATKATAGEKICMTTKSSLQKCMDIAADHARICGDQLSIVFHSCSPSDLTREGVMRHQFKRFPLLALHMCPYGGNCASFLHGFQDLSVLKTYQFSS